MSLDGLCLRALIGELKDALLGGRIDKIQQPDKDEIALIIRSQGKNQRLLLSIHPNSARIHLAAKGRENPMQPPLFCMVMRKHFEGGRILDIYQQGWDRVLVLVVEAPDELGGRSLKEIRLEIMGKHSNLILLDPADNRIIDGLKRYTHAVSRHREVLPGKDYVPPPEQEKLSPDSLDEESLWTALQEDSNKKASKALQEKVAALSPQTAREVLLRANVDIDAKVETWGQWEAGRVAQVLRGLAEIVAAGHCQPTLGLDAPGVYKAFSCIDLLAYGEEWKEHPSSLNETLDIFYRSQGTLDRITQIRRQLLKVVDGERERVERKMDLQQGSIMDSEDLEELRRHGDLLKAYLYLLKEGMTEVTVDDYTVDPPVPIMIPLDPFLSPSENAQYFFRRYNKAKVTKEQASLQWLTSKSELDYLHSLASTLELADSVEELAEIRRELAEAGYVKAAPVKNNRGKGNKGKEKESRPQPMSFVSRDGYPIWVGKNNRQNDYLTMKLAKDEDWWLHVKDIPGSHVVVRGPSPLPLPTLEDAATLAAYYSQSREGSKIPVDLTQRKHVWKPSGAKPGMVLYDHQETFNMDIDQSIVERLTRTAKGEQD